MNIRHPGNRFPRPPRDRQGIALIIVLASLVLVTILVVAFLSNAGTELKTSRVYANGASVKLLTQSAVNLVQSEINDATHDGALCWASQPGMIRTFDNTGMPVKYYKLYSDNTMVNTGVFTGSSGVPPGDWYSRSGIYVDLNQPVAINGVNHFPIVDGDSTDLTSYTPSATIGSVQALAPVNATTNTPQVAGFWLKNAPVQPGSANQAPMPVKWLYVLRDGSILAPDAALSGSGAVTFSSANASLRPDRDMKQIVGRIAFWTDDETAKVNINTAAEGACLDGSGNISSDVWDTPRFRATDVTTLAKSQPVQNEFQRYPGHPSTVSLSAVFGNLVTDGANPSGLTYPENIYPLTPRINGGGSTHGTVLVMDPANTNNNNGTLGALALRTDRLYDTVDEFVFQKDRTLNSSLLSGSSALDQTKIEKAKFFLTAASRAPDVNLFNQPRVSMWPVSSVSGTLPNRSPKDQLIAFCSTVNSLAYYFQRKDPNDPNTDLPPVAQASTTGLGRNRQLLEYLRNAMSQPIPGFGGSFGGTTGKYNYVDTVAGSNITGHESDQILTEIFDYIRATNIRDQSMATTAGSNPVLPYTSAIVPSAVYPYANGGFGQVVPIVDQSNGTRGFGRFPTLQQAALIFYSSKDDGLSPPSASQMSAFFVMQFFDPAMGYPWALPYYQIKVTGLGGFLWDSSDSSSTMFATDPGTIAKVVDAGFNLHPMDGGVVGWRRIFHNALPTDASYGAFFSKPYPANTSNISYAATAPSGLGLNGIHFKGGPVKVEIYQSTATGAIGTLLQTINFTMPDAPSGIGFPLPALSLSGSVTQSGTTLPVTHVTAWETWNNRWASEAENGSFGEILSTNDVIRSVVATPGDMRLIAARQTISLNAGSWFFAAHPAYFDSTAKMAHNLQTSYGDLEYQASMTSLGGGGRLVPLSYDQYFSKWSTAFGAEYAGMRKAPLCCDVPTANGVFVGGGTTGLPGDWDNGVPSQKDGAYINKPDEGDDTIKSGLGGTPYFGGYADTEVSQTFFSPNRMIPSPGMFGSLPSGVLANKPWQTLLFRPGPAGHPGLGSPVNTPVGPPYTTPPDHLIMDLFTMPVVEPYAISEPLSTAGRVNMNYQIIPFTYITRNTAVQAALRGAQVMAVPDADAKIYKFDSYYSPSPPPSAPYRMNVDMMKTLAQFDARFNNNDVFRSPTEICDIDLVPSNFSSASSTRAGMDTYWLGTSMTATNGHKLTGDNSRERPYANLYPLLTTKSNTFTIHFRVQTLKKVSSQGADYTTWKEGSDVVTGEYRGSQTIERYIDANGAVDSSGNAIPNFADPANYSKTLAPFYKFRVISTRQFAP